MLKISFDCASKQATAIPSDYKQEDMPIDFSLFDSKFCVYTAAFHRDIRLVELSREKIAYIQTHPINLQQKAIHIPATHKTEKKLTLTIKNGE